MPRQIVFGFLLVVTSCVLGAERPELTWNARSLPALPDAFGFGGPIVGTHNGVLVVAGGANFPNGPPWPVGDQAAGDKVWHDRIFVLEPGAGEWLEAGKLPQPRAYAACVTTSAGIYVLGGETFGTRQDSEPTNYPLADVLLLKWNAVERTVEITEDALPPLPRACDYHAAAMIGSVIYVTASHTLDETSDRLDNPSFWALDLKRVAPLWNGLEIWPGPARRKMALVAQHSGADDKFDNPTCLYMISGETWVNGPDGQPDLSKFIHFTDAYRYSPQRKQWKRIADLPELPDRREINLEGYGFDEQRRAWRPRADGEAQRQYDVNELYRGERWPAAAAPAIDVGQSHILVFSGATGRYVTMDVADRPLFPRDVLAYHTITDTWIHAGDMPAGVVTTSAVHWDGRIVIPSGEIRPGVRTPQVQSLVVSQPAQGFEGLNMIVVGAYLALLVGMGVYFSKREKGVDDFFLAGRRIPWWAAGISIYATQLSAITFVSLPAVPYVTNWLVYPGQWTIFLMAPVVVFLYLPFFRHLNVTTAYEYLERRFNIAVRLFGSASFIVFQFARMGVVVYVPALALAAVTGMDIYLCILLMGVLSTLYTVLGGMEAVIWTDVIQVGVLWGGMLLALGIIVADVGGIGDVVQVARQGSKLTMFNWDWHTAEMATWLILIGNFALQFAPYTTDQAVIQRYMTTKDEKAAARSVWLNGVLTIPFALLFFLLGTALYVFYKAHPDMLTVGMENDKIFPHFVAQNLPPGISGLVVAGVFAASMSSLDSSMHSVATAVTTDLLRRFRTSASDASLLRTARWLTFVVGTIGTATALVMATYDIKSLLFFFQKLLGLISSGLVGVFILGMFTRRATTIGVLVGVLVSFGVLAYVSLATRVHFYLYAVIGIVTAVAVGYVASMLTPAPSAAGLAGLTWWTRGEKVQ